METLCDAIQRSLAASCVAPDGVAAPVAVIWPDPDGQWRSVIESLQANLPELFVLGDFAPAKRTGPVIWLKCIVERTLPDVSPPADKIPILYLPGVSRQILRAGGECPNLLQPLIELQYRGVVWHQRNGRDWTVEAFLTSDQGVSLDIALDARTREAMVRALPLLANEPLSTLRGHRLEAEDFDRLAVGDSVRDLLMWMNDPPNSARLWAGARWSAFRDVCRREFDLDPEQAHPRDAGELLLTGGDRWDFVWRRFCEAPKAYPGVARLLREVTPRDLFVEEGRQPTANESDEARLAKQLEAATKLDHAAACRRLLDLENEHGKRRGWVWAGIGQSPLATALLQLSRLATAAQRSFGGPDVAALVKAYAEDGWRCDDAALQALASPGNAAETALVARVVRSLYEPWLDRTVRTFQERLGKDPAPQALTTGIAEEKDVCVVFVDGLRFDLAQRLAARLEARGAQINVRARLTTVPTVTATAKPAITSPARAAIEGREATEDFSPVFRDAGTSATTQKLHDWMAKRGVEVFDADEVRMPVGGELGAWTEFGRFDYLGHTLQGDLPRQLDTEIEALTERILTLLNGGWSAVRVVTDHGWLLLPGGLPKVELPHYLTASKWSRCATIRGGSSTTVPEFGWSWNPHVRIAVPHGIGVFFDGNDYAHGGVSPQECITPEVVIRRQAQTATARIADATWRGMRCRVQVENPQRGMRVDLRSNWKQPASSIAASPKELDEQGVGSLAVADDSKEGSAAMVVLLDAARQVIDHQATTVGDVQ